MLYRLIVGAMALSIYPTTNNVGMAAGAVAVGQPSDISKEGVASFTYVNSRTFEDAKERAMKGCKEMDASSIARSLCKIVATFENQCVVVALDPESGTPGFGWAMARNSKMARQQALSNCRDTAGPARRDKCIVNSESTWCDGSAR